jgi:hypothetical protein
MEAQQAPQSQNGAASAAPAPYKRASRKGAPRRFGCDYPGCDKLYSRAEHLQRHQLNRACTCHIPSINHSVCVPVCN